jgi:hypothetical protein
LEGTCKHRPFKAFSDKRVLFAPIDPEQLIAAVRTAAVSKNVAGARHEVSVRYAWQARQAKRRRADEGYKRNPISRFRLRELERIFRSRYGITLPDDDAGREDLLLAAHHIALLGDEAVKRIVCWASLWAPWMPKCEAKAFAERVTERPLTFKAETLGSHLRLTDAERTAFRITTTRAIGVSTKEMAERRKQADRERKAKRRRLNKLGKPEPITRQMPWRAQGISRATWYRQRKAAQKAKAGETKCVRSIEKNIAADRICLTPPVALPRNRIAVKHA